MTRLAAPQRTGTAATRTRCRSRRSSWRRSKTRCARHCSRRQARQPPTAAPPLPCPRLAPCDRLCSASVGEQPTCLPRGSTTRPARSALLLSPTASHLRPLSPSHAPRTLPPHPSLARSTPAALQPLPLPAHARSMPPFAPTRWYYLAEAANHAGDTHQETTALHNMGQRRMCRPCGLAPGRAVAPGDLGLGGLRPCSSCPPLAPAPCAAQAAPAQPTAPPQLRVASACAQHSMMKRAPLCLGTLTCPLAAPPLPPPPQAPRS